MNRLSTGSKVKVSAEAFFLQARDHVTSSLREDEKPHRDSKVAVSSKVFRDIIATIIRCLGGRVSYVDWVLKVRPQGGRTAHRTRTSSLSAYSLTTSAASQAPNLAEGESPRDLAVGSSVALSTAIGKGKGGNLKLGTKHSTPTVSG